MNINRLWRFCHPKCLLALFLQVFHGNNRKQHRYPAILSRYLERYVLLGCHIPEHVPAKDKSKSGTDFTSFLNLSKS